jgi:hypothetical protein
MANSWEIFLGQRAFVGPLISRRGYEQINPESCEGTHPKGQKLIPMPFSSFPTGMFDHSQNRNPIKIMLL